MQRLNAPESALIITVGHDDEARFQRYKLSKEQRDASIARFLDEKDGLTFLVVCDMLLTGFDAPVEPPRRCQRTWILQCFQGLTSE